MKVRDELSSIRMRTRHGDRGGGAHNSSEKNEARSQSWIWIWSGRWQASARSGVLVILESEQRAHTLSRRNKHINSARAPTESFTTAAQLLKRRRSTQHMTKRKFTERNATQKADLLYVCGDAMCACERESAVRSEYSSTQYTRYSGWAFGHYVLGFVQGTAQNCPKRPKLPKMPKTAQNYFFSKIYIKIYIFSIKFN